MDESQHYAEQNKPDKKECTLYNSISYVRILESRSVFVWVWVSDVGTTLSKGTGRFWRGIEMFCNLTVEVMVTWI